MKVTNESSSLLIKNVDDIFVFILQLKEKSCFQPSINKRIVVLRVKII